MRNHRQLRLLLILAVAAQLLVFASHGRGQVDTDGDGLLDLMDVPGFDPDAEGWVDFSGRGIEDLDGASLLTNVTALLLYDNRIPSIECGDFDGLSNLRGLHLAGNRITSIESCDFDGLSNLESLRLHANQITSIERRVFDGLANLQALSLDENRLTGISSGAFDGLANLQELLLGRNNITSLRKGDLAGLPNLLSLELASNQITTLESNAFAGLASLQWLDLGNNQISAVKSGHFEGLTSMNELDLISNPITSIESRAFADMASVSSLYISSPLELNLTGARFESIDGGCSWYKGGIDDDGYPFCVTGGPTRLILDAATLSVPSFESILSELNSLVEVSLVGLTFSDEYPSDLSVLLRASGSLNRITVDQTLLGLYAEELTAFDAIDGNTVTVVPEASSIIGLLIGMMVISSRRWRTNHSEQ